LELQRTIFQFYFCNFKTNQDKSQNEKRGRAINSCGYGNKRNARLLAYRWEIVLQDGEYYLGSE
jgi:hypothetical protein